MSFANERISRLGLLSSCQMLGYGLQRLVDNDSTLALTWRKSSSESALDCLFAERVDLMIIVLNAYHGDLLCRIRLLRTLHTVYPEVRILVIIDMPVPYLLSLMDDWGLEHVVGLGLTLSDWIKSINATIRNNRVVALDTLRKHSVDLLSPAELRTLRLLAQGGTVPEIAQQIMRHIKTVRAQKAIVMKKLGIRSEAQFMAMRAILLEDLSRGSELLLFSKKELRE